MLMLLQVLVARWAAVAAGRGLRRLLVASLHDGNQMVDNLSVLARGVARW